MAPQSLEATIRRIETDPHSGQSLLLYGLLSTLDAERSGCLFRLVKLREMDEASRELAYGLMELMARDGNSGPEWEAALSRAHTAVRGG
jgi:hypothetical protein